MSVHALSYRKPAMLRDFLKNWSPTVETVAGLRQAGALPYALVDGRMAFLLVTSRRTSRWIFPKGSIEPNMTSWESAALEAEEEAGVQGIIDTKPIGSYRANASSDGSSLLDVDIYPMLVQVQLETWKEKHQRLRHWATLSEAKRLLSDPALSRIAVALHTKVVGKANR